MEERIICAVDARQGHLSFSQNNNGGRKYTRKRVRGDVDKWVKY